MTQRLPTKKIATLLVAIIVVGRGEPLQSWLIATVVLLLVAWRLAPQVFDFFTELLQLADDRIELGIGRLVTALGTRRPGANGRLRWHRWGWRHWRDWRCGRPWRWDR